MGRHSGKNFVVKNGSDVIDGGRSFDIDETSGDTTDLTAAGDTWQDSDGGIPGWTVTLSFLLDHESAANQSLRAGDVIAFEGYTEGDASGKTYWSGNARVDSHKIATSHTGESTREYTCTGKGALSKAAVA